MPWTLLLRIVGPLALLALVGAGVWWGVSALEARGYDRGASEVQQRWDQETAARAEIARLAAEKALQDKEAERLAQQKDDDEQARLLADSTAALSGARTERDRLRALVARLNAGAGGGAVPKAGCACGGPDGSAALARELLERCAERREGVAGEAAGLATQLIGLQAWARRSMAVCTPTTKTP